MRREDEPVRADRLVAVLLLLQSRGRVTAAEVAAELEVSERTARRDLEALGMAGLPVYSSQGRNGGWQLLGEGRTDLTGLTEAEARALFLVAGPSAASPELKAALRKLVRALPETFRAQAEAAATSILIDPASWKGGETVRRDPAQLDAVQRAVVQGEQIELDYTAADRSESTRVVHPLGLAAKGASWYLMADTTKGLRTFRVDRITSVTPTGEPTVKPEGFDLTVAWERVMAEVDERRAPLVTRVLAAPWSTLWFRSTFGTRCSIGPAGADGRIVLEIRGRDARSLAAELCGFGDHVEVLGPPEVRRHLAEIGADLVTRYAP